jgi:hypothetical protein
LDAAHPHFAFKVCRATRLPVVQGPELAPSRTRFTCTCVESRKHHVLTFAAILKPPRFKSIVALNAKGALLFFPGRIGWFILATFTGCEGIHRATEHDYGTALVHVCCKCEDDLILDSNALILFNEHCLTHGNSWHRLMMTQPDGSLILAMPIDKNRKIAGTTKAETQ